MVEFMNATHKLDQMIEKNMPPSCSCAHCQQMCCLPCSPRVSDARKLIDAGYGGRLMLCVWTHEPLLQFLTPALRGSEGTDSPDHPVSDGGCTFWNKRHLCDLHASGLKPTEGRLTHHHPKYQHGKKLNKLIMVEWDAPEGRALIAEWKERFYTPPPVRARVDILEQFRHWET